MLSLNRNYQQAIWQSNLSATPSNTPGTPLTAHATPHSKGAYTTLMTTTYDVYGFTLFYAGSQTSGTQTDMMLDVALGASQQNVIVSEQLCGWRTSLTNNLSEQYFPIFIPRGTLVSARIQALITVDVIRVWMHANGGASVTPSPLFSGCDPYGTSAAASQGTSHTPGDNGGESTAADIGATLTKNYGAIALGIGGTLTNVATTALTYHWELVVGGTVVCEWVSATNSAEYVCGPYPSDPFYCSLPAGTQLQIRGESSGTALAQDVAFYCFY